MVRNKSQISRQTMVDKFELLMRQEIINHNKAIESNNAALEDLRTALIHIQKQLSATIANHECFAMSIERDVKDLKQRQEKLEKSISIKLTSFQERLENENYSFTKKIDAIESNYLEQEEFKSALEQVYHEINFLNSKLTDIKTWIFQTIYDLEQKTQKQIEEYKKEIYEKPSDFHEIKKELEKKLEEAVVDAKGIDRKLKVEGKAIFIIEKKIENLYSLIKKMQNSAES